MKQIEEYLNYYIYRNGYVKTLKGIKMKTYKNFEGYKRVKLTQNGKRKSFLIHRLVALAYIPNTYNKPIVNHINSNRTDNRVENLEWVTHKENSQHASRNGSWTKLEPTQGILPDFW